MSLLKTNRPFFLFLLKFTVSYLLLSGIYWLYLEQFDTANNEPDSMTHLVAQQARDLILVSGGDSAITLHPNDPSYRFFINGKSVARIIEGCNAISVMILFVSFIVAFSGTLKRTLLFITAGMIIIHILNVTRISLLCLGFYHYPNYKDITHDIIFPLFIYGVVFLLWVIWVTKLSANAKKN